MSSELLSILFSFQPDDVELQQKREYDNQARNFVSTLSNISPQHFLKGADTAQDVLELLNPEVNSIAYIYALQARILAAGDSPKSPKSIPDHLRPGGVVWNKIAQFLETFDPVQIRYVGSEWRKLLEYVDRVARIMGTPGVAISPIRSGMLRLDPTTGTFTLAHLHFIRLCMENRSYTAALPILDNYIYSLPAAIPKAVLEQLEYSVPSADHINSGEYIHLKSGHTEKITVTDVQEYYMLGALAYIGLRQFKKAMEFLEHVLVVPSQGLANGLMLEAYKKWVLVSCLAKGSVPPTPRTANGQGIKYIRAASKAYEALAEAFTQTNNLPKLKAQINAGKDTWAEDGNTGLVNELQDHQYRLYISRLSKTFSAIPVSNISNGLGGSVEELTDYLETLIKDGHLNACIERMSKSDGEVVLRFFLDPTQGPLAKTEVQQQQALLEQTQRTNVLAEQVKSADYRLSLSKEYVEHLKRQNKKAAANAAGEAMDTTWDDGVEADEDIMGDMH
ncbi:uncharacterized protein BDR25DRAFT_275470 [Lindgomyces ingoldianus]|uniref:Uncharacterized protein n=1 Tax=Lindgomyces ingoldianus TaxID=673940 RepID=A0ACB6RF57_9PLEO|nr:uncharacterized protein BDR25DRAFT_275470 [Lindgomyces ingoldianus]KAF2477928.1 hypothetical protein BDR25DRAFT_275470 [Lindgomyces ingoldianus]